MIPKFITNLKRRRLGAVLGVVLLAFGFTVAGPPSTALAVHDNGLFELDVRTGVDGDQDKPGDPIPVLVGDGNTIAEPTVLGEDWENILADFLDGTPAGDNSGAFAISIVGDTFANGNVNGDAEPWVPARTPEVSFFTGGGSKDTNGIQEGPWLYDTVNDVVPDKNDIVNAFAAAYDDPANGTIFYFGLDTFSVNGASNAGFWFFRQPVGLNPLEPGETTGTFFGEHTDGDVFVAVAYTEGGRVGSVDIYKWQGDDATGSLVLVTSGADCALAAADDDVCGVINKLLPGQTFGEDPVFGYANTLVQNNPDPVANPTSYQYESAAFVEFGLDIVALLGEDIGCFSTFLAETRSSQSETAQLKDFALGAFPVCGIDVTKSGDELSKIGDPVDYSITIENTGRATLYKESIIDSLVGDLTDGTNAAIVSSDCGASLAANDGETGGPDECTITYTYTVQAGDPDPLENTVDIVYKEFADFSGIAFTDSSTWQVELFQPSNNCTKIAEPTTLLLGDEVDYTITLNNTSSTDTPDLVCSISDTGIGFSKDVTLASGTSDVSTPSFTPTSEGSFTNTVVVDCSPDGDEWPNEVDTTCEATVNVLPPGSVLLVNKTGPTLSKAGDTITYTGTISNPAASGITITKSSITDSLVGDLTGECPPDLDPGESCIINYDYTVQEGDPDPLINTLTAIYTSGAGTAEVSDSHEVNLFQPSIAVTKDGDTLSKVGDDVSYSVEIENTSSLDSPDLVFDLISDSLGGDLTDAANYDSSTCGASLAAKTSCQIDFTYTVPEGAADPLLNTVTVESHPDGYTNDIDGSDDHSVELFQPSIVVTKSGDELSKVGDDVSYSVEIENTSSTDSPDLVFDLISDSLGGDLTDAANYDSSTCGASLAAKTSCQIDFTYTVPEGAADPLLNTVTVESHPDGYPNDIDGSDDHSVELFQPSIAVTKDGDTLSKVGDDVSYSVLIENTSSLDSPALVFDKIEDSLGGDLTIAANYDSSSCGASLAAGASCTIAFTYTVKGGDTPDPDPLLNTVTVESHPDGYPNDIDASDDHAVELFQPGVEIIKTGPALAKLGDDINYEFTINNLSSFDAPDLIIDSISDTLLGDLSAAATAAGCDTLAFNQSCNFTVADIVDGPDPTDNTVTVHYHPDGFTNDIMDDDNHKLNLFQPSISIEKTGDAVSKVGDDVAYVITLNNTSSTDTPDLECTITDTKLGINKNVTLASKTSDVTNATYTVLGTDPDPLLNTASASCSPVGWPNVLADSDGHSVDLFQPSITFEKTGDAVSKVGDDVAYVITLNNTSSTDTPDLECTITDTKLGINKNVTLASKTSDVTNATYTVLGTDSDPLLNTANVSCSPVGWPNTLTDSDGHSVNLFQPSFDISKTGDAYSKTGDTVNYTITLENTSSDDAPALSCQVTDSLEGSLGTHTVVKGTKTEIEFSHTVTPDEGDVETSLTNTATAICSADGYSNNIQKSASFTTTLLHPDFTVSKACPDDPVPQEGPAVFTVTFSNSSDSDLEVKANEELIVDAEPSIPAGTWIDLPKGTSKSYTVSINGPFSGQETVSNTINATARLDPDVYGDLVGPNEVTKDASDTCDVAGRTEVLKLTNGVVNSGQDWSFALYDGPHTTVEPCNSDWLGDPLVTDTTLGDGDGVLDFLVPPVDGDPIALDPLMTYTICELGVPGAWSTFWKVDTNGDGVADTVVMPYNPNACDDPPQDLGNRCFDFGDGTPYPIPPGGTLVFEVNNEYPGGAPRTPGYWKNWNTCTGGNQQFTATENAGCDISSPEDVMSYACRMARQDAGFFLLDDILTSPGVIWCDFAIETCEDGVRILDQRDSSGGKKNGVKHSRDAAYTLAMHLLAAQLNFAAGACTDTGLVFDSDGDGELNSVAEVAMAAEDLLCFLGFDGTTEYLRPLKKNQSDPCEELPLPTGFDSCYQYALELARVLDEYNNGCYCGDNPEDCGL